MKTAADFPTDTLRGTGGARRRNSGNGFTILEAMISLAVLCAVVVPLLTAVYRTTALSGAREELTGMWLIEREAAIVRAFPGRSLPVKRYPVNRDEWTLRTEVSDGALPRYRIVAEVRGAVRAEALFYGREAGKR